MYKLDYSKAEVMQISNDAYYFLKEEEPPIDEDNLEEAYEVMAMFPNGFYITDDIAFVENSDLVEVTFVPYVEEDWDYDEYIDLFGGWQIQIKHIERMKRVRIRFYNPTKEPKFEQECDIVYNAYGKPEIHTKSGSIYPLWKDIVKVK